MSQEETGTTDPLIGQIVGSYEVVGKLGEGGMGDVYELIHPSIGKRLALKVLHAEYASRPEIVERFKAEALAVNRIGHPNIVDILDFQALEDGRPYLLMEYLEGESLAACLRRTGPLPVNEVANLLFPICSAVGAAHEHGITHRDLKPENIQLVPRPTNPRYVKVLDFGIAKLGDLGSGSGPQTRTGVVMGTPTYMSPEQAMGRSKEIDHRSDIYALGIITYQMLTGMVPFSGESFGDLMLAHLQAIPRPVFELHDGIPPVWNDLVQIALAKDRNHRFQSMAEMADAVRAALEGRPLAQRAQPAATPGPAGGAKTVALPAAVARGSASSPGSGSYPGAGAYGSGSYPGTGSYPGSASYPGAGSSPGVAAPRQGDSIPPAAPSKKLVLPIALGAVVAAATAVALVMFLGGGPDTPAVAADAGVIAKADAAAFHPVDAAKAAAKEPVIIDAAPEPPPDARPKKVRRPPKTKRPPRHRPDVHPEPRGDGYVQVTAVPWAYVYVDGKRVGTTPGRWKVSAGRHRIRLVNPELGTAKTVTVKIQKDETERIRQRW